MRPPVVVALAAAVVLGGGSGCDSNDSPVRAAAGVAAAESGVAAGWKPWVLPRAGAIPVPPPTEASNRRDAPDPASHSSPDVLGREWMELAMEFIAARTKDPPAASRAYAYVAVSAFDAAVAASDAQRTHRSPGYPSVDAAVAGAASRTLAFLFPEQSALRLDQRAARAATGSPAARAAGLQLGRAVADALLARARTDGADQVWDGMRPAEEPRYWSPPPGSVSPPVQPAAGSWATWVLPNGSAVRPPAPPEYGGPSFLSEARELVRIGNALTRAERRVARYWEGGEGTPLPPGIWNRVVIDHLREVRATPEEGLRALTLVNIAMADAGVAAWDAKYTYWTPRPENAVRDLIDPEWQPLLATPLFPAYVSGHSTYSAAAAEVLAGLFPDDAESFRAMAEEAGLSRLLGGIHYRHDHVEGRRMGRHIGRLVVAAGAEHAP